ncbi:MAG: hypothetical protein AB1598_06010 [Thermodesulfobacteriota bacterium]
MKAIIKRKLAIHIREKISLDAGSKGEISGGGNERRMKAHYFHERLGISFRVIGLLFEDERYEIYHARNKKYDRDLILHFRKENGRRRFNVPNVNFERHAQAQQVKPPKEVNLPWDNRVEKLKGH